MIETLAFCTCFCEMPDHLWKTWLPIPSARGPSVMNMFYIASSSSAGDGHLCSMGDAGSRINPREFLPTSSRKRCVLTTCSAMFVYFETMGHDTDFFVTWDLYFSGEGPQPHPTFVQKLIAELMILKYSQVNM